MTMVWLTMSTTPFTLGSHSSMCRGRLLVDAVVVVVDLDFDGLRRPRQVADQVFQDVRELDLDGGLGAGDLVPQFGRDLFQGAAAVALQLDQEVARVGLRDGQRQARAGAARVAFDFRRFAQVLLDVAEDAVGLLERRAGGHACSPARRRLRPFRAESRCQAGNRSRPSRPRSPAVAEHDRSRVIERPAQGAFVTRRQPAQDAAFAGLLGALDVGFDGGRWRGA